MWRVYIVGALLLQGALIILALPQVKERAYIWTAGRSLSASSLAGNHSIADIDVDRSSSSGVNQSAVRPPSLSDAFVIPGTDLIADIALFSKPISYVEVVSILEEAVDNIRNEKNPKQELRDTYLIKDTELGGDTSFFIRSGVVRSRRYLTWEDVVKVINDGLLPWAHERVQEGLGLCTFSFRIISDGIPPLFVDGAVDKTVKAT